MEISGMKIEITGDIESITQECREIEPILDDKGVKWKQFEPGDCIVVTGKNLKQRGTYID
jgi:hypothetical protein